MIKEIYREGKLTEIIGKPNKIKVASVFKLGKCRHCGKEQNKHPKKRRGYAWTDFACKNGQDTYFEGLE